MITGQTQVTPIDDAPSVLTLPSPNLPNEQKQSQQMTQTDITIPDVTFTPIYEAPTPISFPHQQQYLIQHLKYYRNI